MPLLDQFMLARLARERAINVASLDHILSTFDLTQAEYNKIEKSAEYKRLYDQFLIEWNGALSTPERVRIVSAALCEQALPSLTSRMMDEHEPLTSCVETAKFLARNAGIGEPKALNGGSGEAFTVTINFGNTTPKFEKTIEVAALPPVIDE